MRDSSPMHEESGILLIWPLFFASSSERGGRERRQKGEKKNAHRSCFVEKTFPSPVLAAMAMRCHSLGLLKPGLRSLRHASAPLSFGYTGGPAEWDQNASKHLIFCLSVAPEKRKRNITFPCSSISSGGGACVGNTKHLAVIRST